MEKIKPLKVLVMSVGKYPANGTAKFLKKIGAPKDGVTIVLPKQYAENAESYEQQGLDVYIYDEQKYIDDDFEFFGFKRRNCGGVGRQGIYEATLKYKGDFTCLQLDDDTGGFELIPSGETKYIGLRTWESFERLFQAIAKFSLRTGLRTGATIHNEGLFSASKIFNNFLMFGDDVEGWGFKSLCSDDYRFNYYCQMTRLTPFKSLQLGCITFTQSQGQRNDGNAPVYNGDYAWKKAITLGLMVPWAWEGRCKAEGNKTNKHQLFRENLKYSYLFPPVHLTDENGKIIGRLRNG